MRSKQDEVTLTIDGIDAEARAGATILEAAMAAGIEIPHMCYDPKLGLAPNASCRLCIVEVEGAASPVASCVHPVSDGMVVRTDTDDLRQMRRRIIEFFLSDHSHDDPSEECVVEEWAYKLGVRERPESVKHAHTCVDAAPDDPTMVYNRDECILCGRCVAVCSDIQGVEAIDFMSRGFEAEIGLPPGTTREESECEVCGNCVVVCPTWAMKAGRMQDLRDAKKVRTTCTYCGVGCQLDLNVLDGRVVGVTSAADNPVNGKWLCVKGRFGYEFIHSPERLKTPMIRRNGKLEPASWDEALDYIATRLKKIKAEYGPDAISVVSSSRCSNEDNYLAQKLARAAIGTHNIDQCARGCHAPSVAGLALALGSGAMSNSIAEIPDAEVLFIIGANPTEAHPIIGLKMKEAARKGAKLIIADPREIWLTKVAYLHLPLKPGTDLALINGMAHVILSEGLADEEFIKARTEGFEEYRKIVEQWPPERAAQVCGVPADDIRLAAREYAKANPGGIYYTLGITEHTCGTHNVMGLANLAMMTGQIGKESSGINPMRGQNNVQGACDMGALPYTFPGYQRIDVEENRRKFEEAWNVSMTGTPGLMIPDMMQAALAGGMKAMYVMGIDLAMTEAHSALVREALSKLDLLVVQEIFPCETDKLAHVVLPASCFAEKDGTFTNTERRVQRIRKAVDPPGKAWEDWRILAEISNRLGYPINYSSPEEIYDEMASLSPIFSGISYSRIEKVGIQWPCPSADHPGTKFMHTERFTRGLGKFHPVDHTEPAETPDDEYPWILSTGRNLYHYNDATMTRRVPVLTAKSPECYVEINPRDLENLGVDDGYSVRVVTRRGSVIAKALATDRIKPGVLWMPFHFAEASANELTVDAYDNITKTAEYKVAAARVEVV